MTGRRRSDAEVRALIVADLPRRVAHATYALLYATREEKMPPYAREVVLYDPEALSAQETGTALHQASRYGLTVRAPGGLWLAREAAHELEAALEERFLRETDEAHDGI